MPLGNCSYMSLWCGAARLPACQTFNDSLCVETNENHNLTHFSSKFISVQNVIRLLCSSITSCGVTVLQIYRAKTLKKSGDKGLMPPVSRLDQKPPLEHTTETAEKKNKAKRKPLQKHDKVPSLHYKYITMFCSLMPHCIQLLVFHPCPSNILRGMRGSTSPYHGSLYSLLKKGKQEDPGLHK